MQSIDIIKDKILGCLYGQAIGDALGIQSEFMTKRVYHYHTCLIS